MRVLMVQTPSVEGITQERVYPIGIVSLASHLKAHGHEPVLLDMNLYTDPYAALKEKLLDFQPEAVGVSLRNIDPLANKTSSLIPPFIATVRLIKAVWPQARLIAGGTGFSLFPERLMQELPEIDYGIIGEAEYTLPTLLASLDNPPALPGLYLRQGSRIRRRRPAKEVVNEIELLHKEYGIESFHFTDPVVNIPSGHLEEICAELLHRKLKIRWDGFFREDMLDEHNVALFERAGCECFSFSPDGLCQENLDTLGKRLSEADILKAANLTSRTEVVSVYHFMVNVPGESNTTIEKGIRLLEQIYDQYSAKRNLGTIILNNLRILPGTLLEAQALSLGVIGPETDLIYPTYYNPKPFDTLRYRLETLHLCRNVFMWQEVRL